MEVISTIQQDVLVKIRVRSFLLKYFWPFFGLILALACSYIVFLWLNLYLAVTFFIVFIWFYLDVLSPNAAFYRAVFQSKSEEERLINRVAISYFYINSGKYSSLSGTDYMEKIINFLKDEFERFLRFVLHPVILIPYSIYTFKHFNYFSSYGDGAPFLYFSAIILLWYTNETFIIRKNQEIERMSKIKSFKRDAMKKNE
jgi:hypothetical protein